MKERKFSKAINTTIKEKIIREIIFENSSVTSISKKVGISPPAVFKNIKLFKSINLIQETRDNNFRIRYKIKKPLFGIFYMNDSSLIIREYEEEKNIIQKQMKFLDLEKEITESINRLYYLLDLRNRVVKRILGEIEDQNLEEIEKKIIKMYLTGINMDEISQELDIDLLRVKEIIDKFFSNINE